MQSALHCAAQNEHSGKTEYCRAMIPHAPYRTGCKYPPSQPYIFRGLGNIWFNRQVASSWQYCRVLWGGGDGGGYHLLWWRGGHDRGALSGPAIFKRANPETQALAQQMAQRLDDALSRASLNQSRRAIAAQMMKAYGPQADDIAQGNNDAARVAEILRIRAAQAATDPAQLTKTALADF